MSRDVVDYVYTDVLGAIDIPQETFRLMAEIVSQHRAALRAGLVKEELSENAIRAWFQRAISHTRDYKLASNLGRDSVFEAYAGMHADKFAEQYSARGHLDDFANDSQALFWGPKAVAHRAKGVMESELVIQMLELLVGRNVADSTYNYFVAKVLARLKDAKATHLVDITDTRQTLIPIDLKAIERTFRIVRSYYDYMEFEKTGLSRITGELVPNLGFKVFKSEQLFSELQAYHDALLAGQPVKKNPGVHMAVLVMRLKEQIGEKAFQLLTIELGHPEAAKNLGIKYIENQDSRFEDLKVFPYREIFRSSELLQMLFSISYMPLN